MRRSTDLRSQTRRCSAVIRRASSSFAIDPDVLARDALLAAVSKLAPIGSGRSDVRPLDGAAQRAPPVPARSQEAPDFPHRPHLRFARAALLIVHRDLQDPQLEASRSAEQVEIAPAFLASGRHAYIVAAEPPLRSAQ